MTKKIFLGMLAAAAMLATSCQNDLDLDNEVGGTALVTFDVTAPALSTRAIADYQYGSGAMATQLSYAVYDAAGNHLAVLDGTTTMNAEGEATVQVKLTTGNKYKFLFWAQAAGAPYEVDFDAKTLTVDYTGVLSNNENLDAFCNNYAESEITVAKDAQTKAIKLTRPFAQLNIGANDYVDSAKAGYTPTHSSVTVKNIYNTLDLATGDVWGDVVVTYKEAAIPAGNFDFPIEGHENETYKYLAMNYLLVNEQKAVEVDFTLNDGTTQKEHSVSYVPVKRNHRTNIYGQVLTGDVTLNVSIDPIFEDDYDRDVDTHIANVSTAAELAAALTDDHRRIEITLAGDIELSIDLIPAQLRSTGQRKLGGANTNEMIIDLNGNTLTIATDYRAILGANNTKATITLKKGNVETNSTNKKTTWNEYNIGLADCAWVVEDVEFGRSVALDTTTAELKDVTITESKDLYGLWIEAQGQKVTIDGLTLTAGRGIKIDEQYVENSGAQIKEVTLNVDNATFTTQKKAAVVVKSVEGANINWGEGNNITNVAADTTYAVWVDEDAAAHADKVVVTGAKVKIEGETISTADALAAALTANDKNIVVYLADDIELPISSLGTMTSGSGEYKLGGASTENILIDLNGKKLNFTTTYWSAIGAKNTDATITIKNGTVTSTGNSATTWNAYDVTFANCNYVIENVTFNKEVALTNAGKSVTMNNITINGTGNYYALWITAEGQTVSIDNLNVVTPGRGIKIDEQYVAAPEKVTLNISNATFKTAVKAAIMVKSVAGAEINASSLDITNVAADTTFAVWVDEDAAAYANKVVVNGAYVKVEGENAAIVSTDDGIAAAINEGFKVLYMLRGDYGKIVAKSNVSYIGYADNVNVEVVYLNGADNVTLRKLNFDAANAKPAYDGKGNQKPYALIISGDENKNASGSRGLVIDGCTFTGTYAEGGTTIAFCDQSRTSGQSGNITIKNCTFATEGGYCDIYTYYSGYGTMNIENNTFKSDLVDRPIYLGRYQSSTPVVVKGNTFEEVTTFGNAAYIQPHSDSYTVSFDAADNTFAN